ncbi:MAG: D-alanine--D-alanine ligase family protein [Candidatus Faecivivens sp.]|nr:D-alanine--D-alanine ligase [Oscillospiraceae bacterium]MDY2712991.1 D-alanine--D-alanine ligase family protein [Candidatus Faecivivens sp.]
MKIKLGVLFGGKSVEHEVSIISALQAAASINREKYDVVPIYMTKKNEFYIGEEIGKIESYRDGIPQLLKKSQQVLMIPANGRVELLHYPLKKLGKSLIETIDVLFPIVHGTNVEDGALQGYLKTLGVPFVGCDVLASALGMDKYMMKCVWKAAGLPVLDCLRVGYKAYMEAPEAFLDKVEKEIGYPVIVKPIDLGSSVGIRKALDRAELSDAMDYAFQFAHKVLVERAVEHLKEINCSVLGDFDEAQASECEEPVSSDRILTYEEKYLKKGGSKGEGSDGMASLSRIIPANISEEERAFVRETAVKAFQALDCCGVSRIDFMMDSATREIWINEINTIPGSLAFYLWEPMGVKYTELLDRMIDLALKRDRDQAEISYAFDTNILAGVSFGGAKGSKL